MSSHLIDGEFQSDKYPTTPRGKVPLSVKDATAQDLLWEYAQRRRVVDAEFSDDLEKALKLAGYVPPPEPIGVLRLRSALELAGDQFGFYATEHRQKAQVSRGNGLEAAAISAEEKAATNERFAGICKSALAGGAR